MTRIIPPLVTTAAEVDLALAILDESVAAAGGVTARRAGDDRAGPAEGVPASDAEPVWPGRSWRVLVVATSPSAHPS